MGACIFLYGYMSIGPGYYSCTFSIDRIYSTGSRRCTIYGSDICPCGHRGTGFFQISDISRITIYRSTACHIGNHMISCVNPIISKPDTSIGCNSSGSNRCVSCTDRTIRPKMNIFRQLYFKRIGPIGNDSNISICQICFSRHSADYFDFTAKSAVKFICCPGCRISREIQSPFHFRLQAIKLTAVDGICRSVRNTTGCHIGNGSFKASKPLASRSSGNIRRTYADSTACSTSGKILGYAIHSSTGCAGHCLGRGIRPERYGICLICRSIAADDNSICCRSLGEIPPYLAALCCDTIIIPYDMSSFCTGTAQVIVIAKYIGTNCIDGPIIIPDGIGILHGNICMSVVIVIADNTGIGSRNRIIFPDNDAILPAQCVSGTDGIGIVGSHSVLISQCHRLIAENRTAHCANFICIMSISRIRCSNSGTAYGIGSTKGIRIIPIYRIFRTYRRGIQSGDIAIRHVSAHGIAVSDRGGLIAISTYLASHSQRIGPPAASHDTDTCAGRSFSQRIDADGSGSCTIGFTEYTNGSGGISNSGGIGIFPIRIQSGCP